MRADDNRSVNISSPQNTTELPIPHAHPPCLRSPHEPRHTTLTRVWFYTMRRGASLYGNVKDGDFDHISGNLTTTHQATTMGAT
jgi:hypothetical protein